MKTTTLILLTLIYTTQCSGQKIIKNEVDKFTKVRIIETSWEPLKIKFVNALRFRCKSIDDTPYIEMLVTMHDVFRIDEGDRMYFLFNDGTSLYFECTRGEIAHYNYSKYGSYWNGNFLYKLSKEVISAIMDKDLVGVRIGMADEYYVFDEVKLKNAERLRRAVKLITE